MAYDNSSTLQLFNSFPMQLVLNTMGLTLKVEKGSFLVSTGDESRLISPEALHSIAITSPCLLSSAAIELAADAGIPIYFYDETGDARSCLRSPYFESLATLRRKQVYFSDEPAGAAWCWSNFGTKPCTKSKTWATCKTACLPTPSNYRRPAKPWNKACWNSPNTIKPPPAPGVRA